MYAITSHDRALIDQAIAAGAVRHIPRGVSGFDTSTGQRYPTVEAAILAHGDLLNRLRALFPGADPAPLVGTGHKLPDDLDRRIMTLWKAGFPMRATADRLGVSYTTVYRRFRALRPGLKWQAKRRASARL
jgi:hypothetical protein